MYYKAINVPRSVDDPTYRYKMPELCITKSAVTKLFNIADVASSLKIPPSYPLKFIAYELSTAHDDKKFELKGHFNDDKIRDLLDKFIEKYVLCPSCHYPEMIMEIKKGTISGSCYSCGWKGSLDNNHKLAAYIVKNPPKNQSELFKELNRKQPQINETPIDSNSLSDDDWDTGDDDQKET